MRIVQGEYQRMVDVKECFVVQNTATKLKEIIAISFYTTEKVLKKKT